jgi:hypothetical protein
MEGGRREEATSYLVLEGTSLHVHAALRGGIFFCLVGGDGTGLQIFFCGRDDH